MLNTWDYAVLYNNVLADEIKKHNISRKDIKRATLNLVKAYRPRAAFWKYKEPCKVDYNDAAHRCAYLQKYAALHTAMLQEWFKRALHEGKDVKNKMAKRIPNFKICCLGGGPGIDIIGVICVLHQEFGLFSCSAQVIDSMAGWESTFNSVLAEILNGWNLSGNCVNKSFNPDYFACSFITANLLEKMDSTVNKAIGSADLITMVKFLSSVTCKDSRWMVKRIFNSMKHGAYLLFIDNAAGGFSDMVSRMGKECKLQTVFGPMEHQFYSKPELNIDRPGPRSCYETRVTVHMLMKPYDTPGIKETKAHIITKNTLCHELRVESSLYNNEDKITNGIPFTGVKQTQSTKSKNRIFVDMDEESDDESDNGTCSVDSHDEYNGTCSVESDDEYSGMDSDEENGWACSVNSNDEFGGTCSVNNNYELGGTCTVNSNDKFGGTCSVNSNDESYATCTANSNEFGGTCSVDSSFYDSSYNNFYVKDDYNEVTPNLESFERNLVFATNYIHPINQDKTQGRKINDNTASFWKSLNNIQGKNRFALEFLDHGVRKAKESSKHIELAARQKSAYGVMCFIFSLRNFIPRVPIQHSRLQFQHISFDKTFSYNGQGESNSPFAGLWPTIKQHPSHSPLSSLQRHSASKELAAIEPISILPIRYFLFLLQNFIPNMSNHCEALSNQNLMLNASPRHNTSNYPFEIQWPVIKD